MIKQSNNTVVSLNERRKHPRVSDAVALRFNDDGQAPSPVLDHAPTHVVKMSCGGMRFVHETSLEPDTTLDLSLYLPSADQTVHIESRVISSGEEKTSSTEKTYFVQLAFQQVNDQVQSLLKNHIDYVQSKTSSYSAEYYYSA